MRRLIHITCLLGSATPPGRLRRAISEALDRAAAGGAAEVELIDLAERRIAFADGRPEQSLVVITVTPVAN